MRFPVGFRVRVRDDVRRLGDGVLVGGSPIRAVRLAPPARRRVGRDGLLEVTDAASDALAARLVDANIADPLLDGVSADAADLTVVVPVRDRPAQLARCLAALTGPPALRVLVVDDASLDPVAVAKVAADHGAEVLALPVNVGPASARNAGLAQVRTPYVAFVDSDVVADAAMLVRLTRHLADTKLALAGPIVRSRSLSRVPGGRESRRGPRWFERYDEEVSSLALGTRGCSVEPGAAVGWLPSACLVGRVSALADDAIGGFTEGLRVGEDVDLVWRLVGAGHRVRYDPTETAHHDTRTTVRDWLGRKLVYGTGGAPLAARHGRHGAPAVLTLTGAATAAAVLVRRRWSLPVAAAGVGYAWWQLDRRLPAAPGRRAEAGRLAVQGLGWAVRQESALLLRHWWPLTAVLLPSRTVRRAVVTALAVDAVVAEVEHPGAPYQLLARRLDDLAYGAGLWLGALRARSAGCLLPRRPGRR